MHLLRRQIPDGLARKLCKKMSFLIVTSIYVQAVQTGLLWSFSHLVNRLMIFRTCLLKYLDRTKP